MSKIEHFGFEVEKEPIVLVRIAGTDNKWHVQYKKKTGFMCQYIWYTDSTHTSCYFAELRARMLQKVGYVDKLKKRSAFFRVG